MPLHIQPNNKYDKPPSIIEFVEREVNDPKDVGHNPPRLPSAILVCGGRDYHNKRKVFDTLDNLCRKYPIAQVITGDAKGADTLATHWVHNYNSECGYTHTGLNVYRADWNLHGKSAGPKRNTEMLTHLVRLKQWDYLDINYISALIAFPGGRGTANMISQAEAWNKKASSPHINIWRI